MAGNLAKIIMNIEDYYEKSKKQQLKEVIELCIEFYKKYNEWPSKNVLREFVWVFEDRKIDVDKDENFFEIVNLVGNYEMTKQKFYSSKGKFKSYDEFIENCKKIIIAISLLNRM